MDRLLFVGGLDCLSFAQFSSEIKGMIGLGFI